MATLLIFAASIGEIAEAGIITDRLPFYCYVDHKVNTYREPNGQIVGYISADEDLVRVTQVRSDGWAYGDYPISGGKRIARWFRVSELCADPGYSNRGTNVRGAQTVFRLPNSNVQFGSVSNNESVIVLADNGNRAQILYRLNNGQGYKVGWVSSSSVRNGGGNITNIKGDANNDGKVTQEDVNLIQRYIVGNVGDSAINKNNADFNGDGQINIFDMSAILSKIKNNSNVTLGARNPFSNGWYKIHPIHDLGRYVDAAGGNYNVHMWDNAEVPQQKFYLQDRGNGYFSLKSGHGDFYITAAGNGNGANLYVRSWAGSDSQLFKVVDAGNNSYHVVPKFNEHLNWDCAGAGRANGNNVQLWKSEDKDWHKWRFESTSAPQTSTPSPIGNWDSKIGQKLANENSEHYQKTTNPFPKSYTSSRDGSYHATNCTWYAWGRMREVTGKNLSVSGNAGNWHNSTNWDSNLTSMCVAERTTKNGGHVVFVEYVDNNRGRVYYTECNWNVKDDYKVQVADIGTFKSKYQWFIH